MSLFYWAFTLEQERKEEPVVADRRVDGREPSLGAFPGNKNPAHIDGWQGLLTNKLIGTCDRSRGGRAESKALITD